MHLRLSLRRGLRLLSVSFPKPQPVFSLLQQCRDMLVREVFLIVQGGKVHCRMRRHNEWMVDTEAGQCLLHLDQDAPGRLFWTLRNRLTNFGDGSLQKVLLAAQYPHPHHAALTLARLSEE